jgi:hypothetical protein
MYNFSGIMYRIWSTCGFLFFLGCLLIILEKPWKKCNIKKCISGFVIALLGIGLAVIYLSRMFYPNISVYTGEFISSNRDSSVAPPLPLTNEYCFWNGNEKKKVFYLDILSKKEIFPNDFETGEEYVVYYDEFTKIIVKVEIKK